MLDGADLVSVVHAQYPKVAVASPGPGSVPLPGDVISLGPGGGSDPVNGHTAVVTGANLGSGQFTIMSENDPEGSAGEQSLQVDLSGGHDGQVLYHGAWTTASWLEVAPASRTWGKAIEVPGTGALNTGGSAQINSVSCASAGDCGAGGFYTDSTSTERPFFVDEVSGTWDAAEQVPGMTKLDGTGAGKITAVMCGSAGSCSATGYYGEPFVVDEVNGTWGAAAEVPGTAALNVWDGAAVTSVSCPQGGACGAGGYYRDAAGNQQAFVISQKGNSATALSLSALTVTYGYEQAETVSVTASAATTPAGTVTAKAGTDTVCVVTLTAGAGTCTLASRKLPAGKYEVTASCSGDANTLASVSPPRSLTVSRAGPATAVNLSARTVISGDEQAEKVSVTVSAPGTATGTVTVRAGAAKVCVITLTAGAGSCRLRASTLRPGSYQVTGSYSGDASARPSRSPAKSLRVQARHFTAISTQIWAGWSVHPPGGVVRSVTAQWKVPKVTCGKPLTRTWYRSRAGVWAGMWGPEKEQGVSARVAREDWLPQAGTVSLCSYRHLATHWLHLVTYQAVYELAAVKNGHQPVTVMTVHPGDTIRAKVTYRGQNNKHQLLFSYAITDLTRHRTAAGKMPPARKGVRPRNATFQGGVIVEDQPIAKICLLVSPFGGCAKRVTAGGLSRLTRPVSVTEPATTVNGKGMQAYSGYGTLYRWDMYQSHHGRTLATTGQVTPSGFKVTWERYY